MYFYSISTGNYSDYSKVTLSHEVKFTNEGFIEMYNEVIKELDSEEEDDYICEDDLVELLVEKYNFVKVVNSLEIFNGYANLKPITDEDKFVYNDYENNYILYKKGY